MFHHISCLLLLALWLSAHGSRISESCRNEDLLYNLCRCEEVMRDINGLEAKLTCEGKGAVKAANEVLRLSKQHPRFTELQIRNSTSGHALQESLNGFSDLKKLSLSRNGIRDINPKQFSYFAELESLDLSYNEIELVNKSAFQYCINVRDLHLSNNHIASVHAGAFQSMSELQYLDLSHNRLSLITSNLFSEPMKLLVLDLAYNEIQAIEADSFQHLLLLQKLDLSGNKLRNLSHLTFYGPKNLKFLSLAMNNLKMLDVDVFRDNQELEQLNITGNQWVCNEDLLPLYDWLKEREIEKSSQCTEPPEFQNMTVQAGLYVLYLESRMAESPICNASMCNCTVSYDKQIVRVDCARRGFTKLPESLPYKTRVLDLKDNQIKSLNTDHVNATQWADVSFLLLNNNLIDSLKGLEGTWLLRNLVALHLANNHMTEIPIHILEQFRGGLMDELYLSGNPWNCDCNTVRFQTWLQDNYKNIKDFEEIRCSSDSGIYASQHIHRLLKSQLCPQDVQLINYLDVLNGLMASAIVLIVAKLSYDFWLQKRTGKLPRFFSLNL